MTLREFWTLIVDENQLSPTISGTSCAVAFHYAGLLREKRDTAIRNLMRGRRWDAKSEGTD